jgi:hypothetical protein
MRTLISIISERARALGLTPQSIAA